MAYQSPVFVVEIDASQPGSGTYTFDDGTNSAPIPAPSQYADTLSQTVTFRASDKGYRSKASDSIGVVAFPPYVERAFQLNRQVNIWPGDSSVAAAWGNLVLFNVGGQYDSVAGNYNNDGRAVRVKLGQRTLEEVDSGPYTRRSTTGTYIKSDLTLATAAANTSRWDYTTGVAVLLNEAAATNLVLQSADFNTTWTKSNVTVTVNATAAPDGTTTADKVIPTVTNAGHAVLQTAYTAAAAGEVRYFTIFAKPAGYGFLRLGAQGTGNTSGNFAVFNLSGAGSCTVGTNFALLTPTIYALANGWYKCTVKVTSTGAGTIQPAAFVYATNTVSGAYVGDTVSGLYLWGAQFEANGPTSYIATTTAQATRAADTIWYGRGIWTDPSYDGLTSMFSGVQMPWLLTETEFTIPLRDASYYLERPIQQAVYAGTGTYEGPATLAGTKKPKARGRCAHVTPTLIDEANLIYQLTDGPCSAIAVYEGRKTTYTFQADTTNLYAGVTNAGQYRTDVSRGLIQLGTQPQYNITCDVTGSFPVAGSKTKAADIAYYLMTEDLALPTTYADTAAFTSAATAYTYDCGVFFGSDDDADGASAVDRALTGIGATLFPKRDGKLSLFIFRALTGLETPAAALSTLNVVSLTNRDLPKQLQPIPYRIRVGYQRNNTVQTSGYNPTAPEGNKSYARLDANTAFFLNSATLINFLRPNDPPLIMSSIWAQTNAQTLANAFGALFGTRARLFACEVPISVGLGLEIGNIVSLTWPADDLANTRLGQVVGDEFDSSADTMTVLVYVNA